MLQFACFSISRKSLTLKSTKSFLQTKIFTLLNIKLITLLHCQCFNSTSEESIIFSKYNLSYESFKWVYSWCKKRIMLIIFFLRLFHAYCTHCFVCIFCHHFPFSTVISLIESSLCCVSSRVSSTAICRMASSAYRWLSVSHSSIRHDPATLSLRTRMHVRDKTA